MKLFISTVVMTGLLSSCAMWPALKKDSELTPNTQIISPCITDNPTTARQCALLTLSEVGDLLGSVSTYNRGSAYTALAIGTITGGVLAADMNKDVLKGLAVFSGGLLGLNTTVNTNTQRVIYEKALRELMCSVRAFDALQSASEKQNASSHITLYSASDRLAFLQQENHFSALNPAAQALSFESETRKALHFEQLSKDGAAAFRALDSAQTSAASKLSTAVISIRTKVRTKLAGMLASSEEILGTQRDRIVDMTGDIVRRRAGLEKQQDQQTSGNDAQAADITQATSTLIANTASITSVFRQCVDPATQREIEK